jgi:hydrogenase nickel incorporation protein HypA/HybF
MHELSIALSILDGIEEEMQRHEGRTVEAVHVRIGPLSGVVKEALTSAYELARENTPFAASQLVFEDMPIVVLCKKCGGERPAASMQHLCCAECDTPATEIVRGRELELAALELDQ